MKTIYKIKSAAWAVLLTLAVATTHAQEAPPLPANPSLPDVPAPVEPCVGDTDRLSFHKFDLIIIEKRDCDKVNSHKSDTIKIEKKYSPKFSRWNGFYLGVNGYTTPSGSFELGKENEALQLDYARCVTLGFNFIEIKMKIVPHHVGLTTGMGIQWNRYGFKNNYSLQFNNDTLLASYDSNIVYTKNRLRATYLQIPLLLEFKTHKNPKRGFTCWVGVIGAYRVGSRLKQEFNVSTADMVSGTGFEAETKGHFHLNPLLLYGTVAIGYGKHFQVFANYGLNQLFEKGKAPGLVPFTVGLKLM
jgi:hypothetical protein